MHSPVIGAEILINLSELRAGRRVQTKTLRAEICVSASEALTWSVRWAKATHGYPQTAQGSLSHQFAVSFKFKTFFRFVTFCECRLFRTAGCCSSPSLFQRSASRQNWCRKVPLLPLAPWIPQSLTSKSRPGVFSSVEMVCDILKERI